MEGLIIKKGINEESKVNSLNLLMSHKNLEVVYGYIPAKGGIIISSYKSDEIIEFIYIIDGELQYDDDGETVILESGDSFYHNRLNKCFTMYAINDCKVITFSNAGEFNEVEKYWNNLYKAIDEIEEKDHYTKGHCMRVGLYAQKLANSIKQPTHSMRELMLAANVHDVGKCRIPDEILLKPGKFSNEERKIMMEHPIHTYELLKKEFGMTETIAMIAACHHERYDGTGYPYGLRGEEIPIEARIIAIVDTFDAMTTTRPYQEAKTPEKTLEEMDKFSCQFDLKIFEVFKELVLKREIYVDGD